MVLRQSLRFHPSSVSGFPPLCLHSCIPSLCRPHRVWIPAQFRVRVTPSVPRRLYIRPVLSPRREPFGASRVLRHFSSHLPRPEDSGGPSIPLPKWVSLVLPSVYVKTLGVRNKLISKLYQHFRARVAPTAYGILCLRLAHFVRRLTATPPRTQDSIRVGG